VHYSAQCSTGSLISNTAALLDLKAQLEYLCIGKRRDSFTLQTLSCRKSHLLIPCQYKFEQYEGPHLGSSYPRADPVK